jgi:hypothetical protein
MAIQLAVWGVTKGCMCTICIFLESDTETHNPYTQPLTDQTVRPRVEQQPAILPEEILPTRRACAAHSRVRGRRLKNATPLQSSQSVTSIFDLLHRFAPASSWA